MTLGDGVHEAGLSHVALLYDNDDELLDAAVPFLADGVASGAPTLLSVRDRERSLILDGLGATTGVTVVPPWPPGAAFRTLRQNQQLINGRGAAGDRKIRILGEVPCTTETVPWGGWVRYETAINYVYSQLPVSMLCPYDRRVTPSSVLDDVNRTHPFLAAATDGPIGNAGFVDPTAFLGDLSHRDLDPIEAEQPALELVDQLPGTCRRSVSALAESTDLDRLSTEALALAVGEVVTNAVIHGRPPVVLRAWAAEDRVVVVSVLDHGRGPTNPFVGMVPLDTAPAGGLGLHVVYQTCALVTMSWGESDFTVHMTMRPASDEFVSGCGAH
jgi:anti-sigma regulatory factor (Ser/Thr protein kinase)